MCDFDERRIKIMVVDDSLANLKTTKTALDNLYDVFTIQSATKMFALLETDKPSLILLDVNMPDMNGYEAIKILKSRPDTRDIPVIFLTSNRSAENEFEGLNLGAVDYIITPFLPPLLRERIKIHLDLKNFNDNLKKMVELKTRDVVRLQNKILKTVAELVEWRDDVTGGHIERTQHCLEILLSALLDIGAYKDQTVGWDIGTLLQSSQLHDVGKISIKDSILQKPAKLTDEEFEEMKKHVPIGVNIIERIAEDDEESDFLNYAKIFVGYHHEKWNGTGYPNGLSGKHIPLLGRLMAIADVYDALTSERPYKRAFSHEEAVKIILDSKGSHFDPALIEIFASVADKFQSTETH